MPLRALFRYLSNNEQIIQRIADSYPVRRAAQLAAYLVHRGKEAGLENFEKLHESSQGKGRKLFSFLENFKKQVQDGMKQIEENNRKR
ncbi:hypothetical protein CHS0354_022077 [Potamilus streckersoni]|uniref:Uncharacterized protein n=1 Tax=Potamilus streckersoni TaxID=2493646 RepID=A0AAE0SSH1_9BIVA|nr:hypothetical protein CHS0354_022077 [Potamilus streckersoni]